MNDIEMLRAIEEIKVLKARYLRLVDLKDWEAFGELFTADAVVNLDLDRATDGAAAPALPTMTGRENIVSMARKITGDTVTVHHCHMPEIVLETPTTARGIWALADTIETDTGLLHGYGYYHETYRLEGGQWLIASTHLTRLRAPRRS